MKKKLDANNNSNSKGKQLIDKKDELDFTRRVRRKDIDFNMTTHQLRIERERSVQLKMMPSSEKQRDIQVRLTQPLTIRTACQRVTFKHCWVQSIDRGHV